ncbi:hypothetical protein PICMEDRAFT_14051 [Pichia membranifaciens NRRL Y-2026]|uniref:Uncharacterized protein n=1 Tax=Pichia membranifaciens NRRL Y-2026 TaxID=763406 RepID=A0A1E3NQZ7_9ASCO|nr:hypothetical protein PICMEDRAFT_14051 [Pichia membranifaciens NRRL Y-2026]ODQ48484.1 hypothetical protein PICMEDRAFT_14051 [Pichia membranifaciens NRRL Y-2026]
MGKKEYEAECAYAQQRETEIVSGNDESFASKRALLSACRRLMSEEKWRKKISTM